MYGVLVVLILFLLGVVGLLYHRMTEAEDELEHMHAKCIAHIAEYVGNEYAAMVLRAAAHDWDSAEESNRLKVLARLRYSAGGPGMPAIWLNDRADRLLGAEDVTHQ